MERKKTIGITGAGGTLGKALTKKFKQKGHYVIGFTHDKNNKIIDNLSPDEWVFWECNQETLLEKHLEKIDILILNHGIYSQNNNSIDYEKSISINALSKFRILCLFEKTLEKIKYLNSPKEVWINTSEAEIMPALNPSYEISKLLIGQLITFKKNSLNSDKREKLRIRKIIIGPFKSNLNPIGILSPEIVVEQIFLIAHLNFSLIIVSPNPISYIVFPLRELYFIFYCKLLSMLKKLN